VAKGIYKRANLIAPSHKVKAGRHTGNTLDGKISLVGEHLLHTNIQKLYNQRAKECSISISP